MDVLTRRVISSLLILSRGWLLELRQLMRSRLYLVTAVILPLVFASLAHYMFTGSNRSEGPLAIALSAGLMGMWSTTLMGSGSAINRLRFMQVLEPLVACPAPTLLFCLPFALATASMGIYSLGATLVWSVLFFGMPLELASPALFAVALLVTVVSLGLLGLLLASAFILYPTAQSLANFFEYPIWMLSGVLVPVSSLPAPVQYISDVLAPSWGVKAVMRSATGGGGTLSAVLICSLLSALYAGVTLILLRRFEWLARSSGTLALQ
ncbi:ABC-2 type transport system permease protein [Streptomyces umbrinus]|uniref:Transport permease protein n=1 Tax=Streptomyces umbrinus TaxID=67370 RepID=A0ABU0SMH3_9ACTN|nr:ABC transporter permease [Streptomyces umbrinus]MDQ1024728.1 ABC-2 type transport system permease protein [Streptomyces umbrinus]